MSFELGEDLCGLYFLFFYIDIVIVWWFDVDGEVQDGVVMWCDCGVFIFVSFIVLVDWCVEVDFSVLMFEDVLFVIKMVMFLLIGYWYNNCEVVIVGIILVIFLFVVYVLFLLLKVRWV